MGIRFWGMVLGLSLAVVDMGVGWAQPGGRAVPVAVVEAMLRPIAPGRWVNAEVRAVQEAVLAPEQGGRVVWVAREGHRAEQGEVLARLDDRHEQGRLQVARAEASKWEARVGYLEAEERRLARLAKENSAARSQWEEVQNTLAEARAEQRAALARVGEAELDLRRRRLLAPFAGTVSERLRLPGEWAGAGDTVVRLVGVGTVELVAAVPLTSVAWLRPGQLLAAELAGRSLQARLRAVAPNADPRSRQVTVWAEIEAGLPGTPARLWVPLDGARSRLAVPRDALVLRGGGAAVFKVEEGKARRIPVRLGPADGGWIAVSGRGLAPGDKVVVRGGERLRPGQAVRVLESETP